jgi:uncharacterized membrane protein YqaE (UPF0057 family)
MEGFIIMKTTKSTKIARFFMSFLSVFFPWLVLLIYDNPAGAFVALILQATVIGWIPASIWARRVIKESPKEKKGEVDNVNE